MSVGFIDIFSERSWIWAYGSHPTIFVPTIKTSTKQRSLHYAATIFFNSYTTYCVINISIGICTRLFSFTIWKITVFDNIKGKAHLVISQSKVELFWDVVIVVIWDQPLTLAWTSKFENPWNIQIVMPLVIFDVIFIKACM